MPQITKSLKDCTCDWEGGEDGLEEPYRTEEDPNCKVHGTPKQMEFTPHIPLAEIIRRYISKASGWHQTKPNVYHASDVWFCLRKGVFKYTGVASEEGPMGVFEVGRRVEDIVFEALVAHYGAEYVYRGLPVKIDVFHEVPPPPETKEFPLFDVHFSIVGKTDPTVFEANLRIFLLSEIKSTRLVSDNTEPGPHHKHQVAIYWNGLHDMEDDQQGPQHVVILQIERNDVLKIVETEIPRDELVKLADESIEYFKKLHAAVETRLKGGPLPPAEPMMEWECGSDSPGAFFKCPFLHQCREAGGWEKVTRTLSRGKNKGTDVEEWVRTSSTVNINSPT